MVMGGRAEDLEIDVLYFFFFVFVCVGIVCWGDSMGQRIDFGFGRGKRNQ